jgi:histone H3/H4
MDGKARVVAESAVYRILHAHSFSRSSSQASVVLTDLLSRYLILLSSTCAKYTQHGGRTNLTARDAFCALDELGVSMAELGEYCNSEGAELGRYAINTARRVEELKDFGGEFYCTRPSHESLSVGLVHLADGREREHGDQIPLVYAPLPDVLSSDESDEEADEDDMVADVADLEPQYPQELPLLNGTHTSLTNLSTRFLPAFPADESSADQPLSPQSPRMPPPLKIERPPSPLPQPSTPTYASDYFTSIPYDQSSLASIPEWHLPSSRPPRISQTHTARLLTPQTQPTLISAYHHILTCPPPPTASAANPSRHKVAMALLSLTRSSPRWEPPNTLYSSSAPCTPRVAVIGPTFPILISETSQGPGDQKAADAERERKANLPSLPPRAVFLNERITPLITQQPSRIPELARHVLPVRPVRLLY